MYGMISSGRQYLFTSLSSQCSTAIIIGVYIRFSYTFQYHILLYITACDVLLGMDTLSGHSLVFRRLHRFALEIICKMVNKFIFIVRHVLEAWCITWPISDRSLHYVH